MSLPINRTNLAAYQANAAPNAVFASGVAKAAMKDVFDGVDELNAKLDSTLQGIYDSGKFSRLGIINVLDYGAKGDGVTDDASAIQEAINYGISVIYFPNTETNIYTITNTLSLPSNTSILFADGVVLKLAAGINKPLIKNADATNGNSNIKIIGGKFDMNIANQTVQTPAIRFDKITNSYFEKMEVMGTKFVAYVGEGAWHFQNCDDNIIQNCKLYNSGDEGLMIVGNRNKVIGGKYYNNPNGSGIAEGGSYNEYHNVWCDANAGSNFSINGLYSKLKGCISTNGAANNGITLGHTGSPASYSIVESCIVKNCYDGIRVLASSIGVIISNCQVEGIITSGAIGIGVSDSATDCIIDGNRVTNCFRGIHIASKSIVTNNLVELSKTTGIYLEGCKNAILANNISKNNDQQNVGGVGIYLSVTANYNRVTGNQCFDDQTTKTQDRGIYSDGSYNYFDNNVLLDNTVVNLALAANNTASRNILSKTDGFMFDVTLSSGTTHTINNANITKDSKITWVPKTTGVNSRNLFIYSRTAGSFTLDMAAGGASDVITVHID